MRSPRAESGGSEAAEPLQREWRPRERPDREVHERERVVVSGDAIEVHGVAPAAAVDERPLAVGAHAHGDRLHRAGAARGAVAGGLAVEVPAPQAARAVVAVPGTRRIHGDVKPAAPASEGVRVSVPDSVALIARQGVNLRGVIYEKRKTRGRAKARALALAARRGVFRGGSHRSAPALHRQPVQATDTVARGQAHVHGLWPCGRKRRRVTPHGEHPRTIGWLGTSALAMGGSNQMVFLVGALIAAQGSGAIPILIVGVLLGWAAAPGWIELVLMWPKRVGGIAATCAEAFRPYSPVLANLTGVCYWWGWVPTCGFTAILSATALHEWYLPLHPGHAAGDRASCWPSPAINLLGVRAVTRVAIPVACAAAVLAFLSALIPVLAGTVDYERAVSFHLDTPFDGFFGAVTSAMAGLYLVGFAAPAFEAADLPRRRDQGSRRATSRAPSSPAARWPGCSSSCCRSCGSARSAPTAMGGELMTHARARPSPRCSPAAPRPRRSGS